MFVGINRDSHHTAHLADQKIQDDATEGGRSNSNRHN